MISGKANIIDTRLRDDMVLIYSVTTRYRDELIQYVMKKEVSEYIND